jgi:hypothetical protein
VLANGIVTWVVIVVSVQMVESSVQMRNAEVDPLEANARAAQVRAPGQTSTARLCIDSML